MICGLKLLLYEDNYLLGLQKRAVDNDHATIRTWLPGSQSPPSRTPLLFLPAPAFPLAPAPAFVQLVQQLTPAAGLALTSLYCRRRHEVSDDQLFGWAGIHPRNKGKARAQEPALLLLLHFVEPLHETGTVSLAICFSVG